jgi:hypothetical protein
VGEPEWRLTTDRSPNRDGEVAKECDILGDCPTSHSNDSNADTWQGSSNGLWQATVELSLMRGCTQFLCFVNESSNLIAWFLLLQNPNFRYSGTGDPS